MKRNVEIYLSLLRQGDFEEANKYLKEIVAVYARQKQYHEIYYLLEEAFFCGACFETLIDYYSQLISINPYYFNLKLIDILKRKKSFKILLDKLFHSILWIEKINFFDFDFDFDKEKNQDSSCDISLDLHSKMLAVDIDKRNISFMEFIVEGLIQKNNYSLQESKILFNTAIDLQLINKIDINYLKVMSVYANEYERDVFARKVRSFS